MDVYEAITARRSVRSYRPDAVPEDTLTRILGAGRAAPSGRNRQFWRVAVVREEGARRRVAAASPGNPFVAGAPVVLAHLGLLAFEDAPPPGEVIRANWTWEMYVRYNVAIAAAYVTLAATAEGLGTCWINNYDEEAIRAALNVPPTHSIVCLMTLGYPAETPAPRPRHPLAVLRVDDGFPDG
jgi:nitroreductase